MGKPGRKKIDMWGVDRVLKLYYGEGFIDLPVSARTLKKWRGENPNTALQRLIEKCGTQVALASRLGISQKTVSQWVRADTPAPVKEPTNGVERAAQVAGGQPQMALALGVTQQCVSRWCREGFVPAARAQEIEHQFGVPRAELLNPKLRNALGVEPS